jgi:hypothetical protein
VDLPWNSEGLLPGDFEDGCAIEGRAELGEDDTTEESIVGKLVGEEEGRGGDDELGVMLDDN